MKDIPLRSGLSLSPELDSDESSSIFNSENDRPVSDSPESIRSPPPIGRGKRQTLSQQLLRRESAMKEEGPAQWTLARAEQASVAQRGTGAP